MKRLASIPLLYRWLLYMSGWLAPSRSRKAWRQQQFGALGSLWVLLERGELPLSGPGVAASFCGEQFREAFFLRRSKTGWRFVLGSPAFAAALAIAVFSATTLLSGGLTATRVLLGMAHAPYGDRIFGHGFILALASLLGLRLIAIAIRSMNWHGIGSTLFFTVKMVAIATTVTLIWIEGSAGVHSLVAFSEGLRVASRLILAFAFLFCFGMALQAGVEDQKRRCPHCLQRLDLAVSLGSWGSVFDPATTELLCPSGHGSLALPEGQAAFDECWTEFDESWREVSVKT